MTILVPLEDHLLRQHLSLVEQQYDLVETLQEVLVVVTELLNLHTEMVTLLCKTSGGFCTLLQRTSSLRALVVNTLKSWMYSFRCFNACTRERVAQPWLENDDGVQTCSCSRSSFLFHSMADMTAAQIMLTASGSERPCFFTFSRSSAMISLVL